MDALGRVGHKFFFLPAPDPPRPLLFPLPAPPLNPTPIPTWCKAVTRAQSSAAKRLAADGDSDLTGFGSIDAFGHSSDEFVLCPNYGIFAASSAATAAALTLLTDQCHLAMYLSIDSTPHFNFVSHWGYVAPVEEKLS
ncbi:hypothetical protein BDZ89DRAFT_1045117 [Hymenopellis radicata]|nr:hypothetical protein BDZ89DRAFT_1045117 [Hymenopellis radicata]